MCVSRVCEDISSASSGCLFGEVPFYHVLYAFGRKRSFFMFITEKLLVLFYFFLDKIGNILVAVANI